MTEFIARRLLQTLVTLFILSVLVFLMLRLTPYDPAEAFLQPGAPEEEIAHMRQLLGLDGPMYVQYVRWLEHTLQGDLGISWFTKEPVSQLIMERFPRTIMLAGISMVVSVVLGVALGLLAALRPGSIIDYLVRILSLAGFAMPSFWFAIMLILLFSVTWRILPTSGYGSPKYYVLPVITLAAQLVGVIASMTAATVIEVLREEYVRTARAKGLRESMIIYRHVVKNAFIALITLLGLQLGALLGGAVIVETVFAWPGLGLLTTDAVGTRDYPMVQALALIAGIVFLGINLLVDILYAVVDPRIRFS
jgi:ABC-type dipeptide/oligopeptide/nickel transport system permease component